jgi:hypothetical protein
MSVEIDGLSGRFFLATKCNAELCRYRSGLGKLNRCCSNVGWDDNCLGNDLKRARQPLRPKQNKQGTIRGTNIEFFFHPSIRCIQDRTKQRLLHCSKTLHKKKRLWPVKLASRSCQTSGSFLVSLRRYEGPIVLRFESNWAQRDFVQIRIQWI